MANEKRLIDANVVMHKINAFAASVVYRGNAEMFTGKDTCNIHEYTRGYERGILDAQKIVCGQDPVDAVEVAHGRWDRVKFFANATLHHCSICGHAEIKTYNYCPNCGADMRERKEDV
jgi:rubrerythrin